MCWANMWIWINYTCTWSWCINKETIKKKLPDLKTWDMICYHDSPLFKICLCIFSWLSNKLTWLTAYKTIITEQTRDFNQQRLPSLFWRWLFRRLTLHKYFKTNFTKILVKSAKKTLYKKKFGIIVNKPINE